jgi:hypothetical protein
MKKNIFLFGLLLLVAPVIKSQVAINTDNSLPDNSAMLDVKSASKGSCPPVWRLTQ